jgi:hypothetical protein
MQLEKENDKKEKKKEEVNEQMKISISHSLEILQDIFGSYNQDLIDSALKFLKEEEEREEQGKSNES